MQSIQVHVYWRCPQKPFKVNLRLGVGVIIRNLWHAAVNQNICSRCPYLGLTKTSIKTFCLECLWLSSPWLNSELTWVCDFLPKKYFHNSHNINHNLDHLISAPTTFHPLCKFYLPCNLSSGRRFLTHPKIVSPTLHPAIYSPTRQFFQPLAPRTFSNLPHPALFSTSRTPHFFQPPAPRTFFNLPHPALFSTSRTLHFFPTSRTLHFFNLPHPAY